jgi:hypothetical protein
MHHDGKDAWERMVAALSVHGLLVYNTLFILQAHRIACGFHLIKLVRIEEMQLARYRLWNKPLR